MCAISGTSGSSARGASRESGAAGGGGETRRSRGPAGTRARAREPRAPTHPGSGRRAASRWTGAPSRWSAPGSTGPSKCRDKCLRGRERMRGEDDGEQARGRGRGHAFSRAPREREGDAAAASSSRTAPRTARAVDVRVVYFDGELHLRRLKGVVRRELDRQRVHAALVRRVAAWQGQGGALRVGAAAREPRARAREPLCHAAQQALLPRARGSPAPAPPLLTPGP